MISIYPDESIAYDHPRYEPFWAAAADLGVVLSLHIGTNRVLPPPPSSASRATSDMALKFLSTPAALRDLCALGATVAGEHDFRRSVRTPSDAEGRIARARIAWCPTSCNRWTTRTRSGPAGPSGTGSKTSARPSDFFHRNVMISFQEDALGLRLRDVVGVGNLVWGSDYPHAESTFPRSRMILDHLFAADPRRGTHTNPRHEHDGAVFLMNTLVLSPNVEFLFADESADFNERVSIAAAAGVRAIEFWGWRDKDVDGLEPRPSRQRRARHGDGDRSDRVDGVRAGRVRRRDTRDRCSGQAVFARRRSSSRRAPTTRPPPRPSSATGRSPRCARHCRLRRPAASRWPSSR